MFLSANSFFLKFLIMLSIMKIFRALLLNNKPYGLAFYSSKLYSEKTGAFKSKLPDIFEGKTHFRRALRQLKQVKVDSSIKNIRNQNRKYTAESIDALMKGLTIPITKSLDAYKSILRSLHPFESTVAELTIVSRIKSGSSRHLEDILEDLKRLRSNTSKLAKEYASRGNNANTSIEAEDLLKEGKEKLEALYSESKQSESLQELLELQKDLRRIPVVELDTPTVVLVGSPNVGKSSIVRSVSSGTPEVNDYPFTTRGVTIGHIVDQERFLRFQVMDTPGLLDRPEEERNEMEKLTFASLLHLPTAVMYVIDPTGMSGEKSTLTAQLNVRNYLKTRFPKRPWLDVISKADVEIPDEVREKLPPDSLYVSVKTGQNIPELKMGIEDLMANLKKSLIERGSIVI